MLLRRFNMCCYYCFDPTLSYLVWFGKAEEEWSKSNGWPKLSIHYFQTNLGYFRIFYVLWNSNFCDRSTHCPSYKFNPRRRAVEQSPRALQSFTTCKVASKQGQYRKTRFQESGPTSLKKKQVEKFSSVMKSIPASMRW